jgi:hypothetical protein
MKSLLDAGFSLPWILDRPPLKRVLWHNRGRAKNSRDILESDGFFPCRYAVMPSDGVGSAMILLKIIAVIFLLFIICFIAIIIEETFLGGRRRRELERRARESRPGNEGN